MERSTARRRSPKRRLNRAYMGGVEQGQRNVGGVNLKWIAEASRIALM